MSSHAKKLLDQLNPLPAGVLRLELRLVRIEQETLRVRKGVQEPVQSLDDLGYMLQVQIAGGEAYSASSDRSQAGLKRCFDQALTRAEWSRGRLIHQKPSLPARRQSFRTAVQKPWESLTLQDKFSLLQNQDAALRGDDARCIDSSSSLVWRTQKTEIASTDGLDLTQEQSWIFPSLSVTGFHNGVMEMRSLTGQSSGRQGGLEVLESSQWLRAAPQLREELLELLLASICPTGETDLLLAPDQMVLQIHESIGHPLELDRILGDERNYAGSSFVTPDMFGRYAYGSPQLTVSFDPEIASELNASAFDDEGSSTQKVYLIREGILKAGIGGAGSQARLGIPGTSTARSSSWNRAPIDRMANLNIEPGAFSLSELIEQTENGVYMETNCSWSIDDMRNSFQFGCEYGRVIRKGQLREVVRRPNYRGRSAEFWRSLKAVGNAETRQILGTPYCGKGEPNQMVAVGHATPPCLFSKVDVFGGEA